MANFNELILGFGNTVALDNILAVCGFRLLGYVFHGNRSGCHRHFVT